MSGTDSNGDWRRKAHDELDRLIDAAEKSGKWGKLQLEIVCQDGNVVTLHATESRSHRDAG